ncbi:MAG: hypothetical protein SGJ13_00240 [Actinomycetota bacterium]|nr:hypothetical protein [Actinomycetota bacterium]
MSDVDSEDTRRRLRAERERLESVRQGVRGEGGDESTELSHYDQHPADLGSDTFEREKDQSILEELEYDLAEIEAALQRVDEGTYGIDEVTGDPIDPERLDAFPTARTNVDTPH